MTFDDLTEDQRIAMAKELLKDTAFDVVRATCLEDIHPAERMDNSRYRSRHGGYVTGSGVDWSERFADPNYVNAVTHPSDYDDFDDDYRYGYRSEPDYTPD